MELNLKTAIIIYMVSAFDKLKQKCFQDQFYDNLLE